MTAVLKDPTLTFLNRFYLVNMHLMIFVCYSKISFVYF